MTPHDPTKTVFRYTLTPSEIPVGGPGHPTSTLTISVTNATDTEHECKRIAFTLPPELSKGAISVSTTTRNWAISQSGPQGRYVAQPQGAKTGLGPGETVGFRFAGVEPSSTPGPVRIEVSEETDQIRLGGIDATLIDKKPAIAAFTADRLYLAPGEEVTFSWATYEADKVKLSWGTGEETFNGGSGSFKVKPQETIVATLTAIKTGGEQRQAQLTVAFARPQILGFTIQPDPAYVPAGGVVNLSWKTLHADRCALNLYPRGGSGLEASVVEVPTNCDNYPQTVQKSSDVVLKAFRNEYNDSRTQPVTIYTPPRILRIKVESGEPGCEQFFSFEWQASGATSAELTTSQGTRSVDPNGGSIYPYSLDNFRLVFLSADHARSVVTVNQSGSIYGHRWVALSCPTGINNPKGEVKVDWQSTKVMSGEVNVGGQSKPIGGSPSGSTPVTLPAESPAQGQLWSGRLADSLAMSWQVEANAFVPPGVPEEQLEPLP